MSSSNHPLGLAPHPGPFEDPSTLYDVNRFLDRTSYVDAHSGTRIGGWMGRRNAVYETTPKPPFVPRFTSMAEQVEKEMGQCKPCMQDLAPAYGPPGAPNVFTSFPVRAAFEDREKWNDHFGHPFAKPSGKHGVKLRRKVTMEPAHHQEANSTNNEGMGLAHGGGGGGDGHTGGGGGGHSGPVYSETGPRATADVPTPGGQFLSRVPVPSKHPPILLGCNIISNGEDQYAHRMTYLNRFFDEDDGEIHIGAPVTMKNKPTGAYNDELFKTSIDNTENKISTGIMTNPYTGEMYETFEDAMPPPNKDKYIPRERFEIVNPALVALQGGIDKNAPPPKKKEICLDVPGVDYGNNVWGDQLYEEERRRRMVEFVNRDIWNNRNGDYAGTLEFAKEKPAGYIGLQQWYRALPYLPPVNELDNHNYIPVTDYQAPESTVVKAEVEVRKADLTTCVYQQPAGPMGDNPAPYVVTQYENKPTLKEFMEQMFPQGNAQIDTTQANAGGFVVSQYQNKPTLKEQMEQTFQPLNAQIDTTQASAGNYVVSQYQNKPTLKEQMEQGFGPLNVQIDTTQANAGNYVVTQYENKPTLKEQMEQTFQPLNAQIDTTQASAGNYVVTQYQNKPTLKEHMEQGFGPLNVQIDTTQANAGNYVVTNYQPKATLKEFMEQTFSPLNAQIDTTQANAGGVVISQFQNKPTLKEQMEQNFAPLNAQIDTTQASAGNYVVSQFQNKPTLKEQMEQGFAPLNAQIDTTQANAGMYVPFQGPLLEVARSYYEYLPAVGRPASFADGVGGDFIGNGEITSKQNRGTDSTDWVALSKVPQDALDTSVTWIGVDDRDTKREFVPNIPMSDMATSFQSVAPRMFGALTPQCNLDLRGEIDDEYNWAHGFAPQIPDVLVG